MLLAALAFAQAATAIDCGNDRDYSPLQRCEVRRGRHDVLDSARRPSAVALGRDAIRHSTTAAMPGGRAFVVELIANSDRDAVVRFYWLSGSAENGWRLRAAHSTRISTMRYRELASTVDQLIRQFEATPAGNDDLICLDGPGYRTERILNGEILTLRGWCPRRESDSHPNRQIAALMLRMTCPDLLRRDPTDRIARRECRRLSEGTSDIRLD